MTNYLFSIISKALIALCLCNHAAAKNLSAAEVDALHSDISSRYAAFESGNFQAFLDKVHPSIYRFAGGKKNYEEILKKSVSGLLKQKIAFISAELGSPTGLYPLGDEEVCFVPRISIMEVNGKKAKSIGFLVAIRKVDGSSWSYLDGSGLRKDQSLLWKLLPELSKNIVFPPNYIEVL